MTRVSREGNRLDQHQPAVDRIRTKKLRQYAEQHIVLAGDIDGVAGCVCLVPVGAEQLLPSGDHAHPVVDLGLGRPGDVPFQQWRLLAGEVLQVRQRNRAALGARVHESNVVLQQRAARGPPIRLHVGGVQRVERCLHLAAIGQKRPTPGLVGRVVQVRRDDFAQRHHAVSDRLHQLIDDWYRGRFERCHSRPIEDEPPARSGK